MKKAYLTALALTLADTHCGDVGKLLHVCAQAPDPHGVLTQVGETLAERAGLPRSAAEDDLQCWRGQLSALSARVERGRQLSGSTPQEYLYGSFARPLEDLGGVSYVRCLPCGQPADDVGAWAYLRTCEALPHPEHLGLTLLSAPQHELGEGLAREVRGAAWRQTPGELWLLRWHLAAQSGEDPRAPRAAPPETLRLDLLNAAHGALLTAAQDELGLSGHYDEVTGALTPERAVVNSGSAAAVMTAVHDALTTVGLGGTLEDGVSQAVSDMRAYAGELNSVATVLEGRFL